MLAGIIIAMAVQAAAAPTHGAEASPGASSAADQALPLEELEDFRGGDGVVMLNEQNLRAINTGNKIQASTVGSGNVTLDNGAFSGFNGVGNFTMNTGHNNNLQSSISINIMMPSAAP